MQLTEREQKIIDIATAILDRKFNRDVPLLTQPEFAAELLRMKFGHLPYEVFGCIWLNNQHQPISYRKLFRGNVDSCSVHPGEIVREAASVPACVAVIFFHNHPSGDVEPSISDKALTEKLSRVLEMVNVRVLDHLIISGKSEYTSFAKRGLL